MMKPAPDWWVALYVPLFIKAYTRIETCKLGDKLRHFLGLLK
jgi:hypothetical protein